MRLHTEITSEMLAQAKMLREQGLTWQAIAQELGPSLSWQRIRYRLDPTYRAGKFYKSRQARESDFSDAYLKEAMGSPAARTRKVVTERFCPGPSEPTDLLGDPPSGRSALDRRSKSRAGAASPRGQRAPVVPRLANDGPNKKGPR
jgi:hypothetical protein